MSETQAVEEKEKVLEDDRRGFNASVRHLEQLCGLIDDVIKYDVNENLWAARNNLKHFWFLARGHLDSRERAKGQKDWEYLKGLIIVFNREEGTVLPDSLLQEAFDDFFSWLIGRLHYHEVTYSKKALKEYGLDMQRKRYGIGGMAGF